MYISYIYIFLNTYLYIYLQYTVERIDNLVLSIEITQAENLALTAAGRAGRLSKIYLSKLYVALDKIDKSQEYMHADGNKVRAS